MSTHMHIHSSLSAQKWAADCIPREFAVYLEAARARVSKVIIPPALASLVEHEYLCLRQERASGVDEALLARALNLLRYYRGTLIIFAKAVDGSKGSGGSDRSGLARCIAACHAISRLMFALNSTVCHRNICSPLTCPTLHASTIKMLPNRVLY